MPTTRPTADRQIWNTSHARAAVAAILFVLSMTRAPEPDQTLLAELADSLEEGCRPWRQA